MCGKCIYACVLHGFQCLRDAATLVFETLHSSSWLSGVFKVPVGPILINGLTFVTCDRSVFLFIKLSSIHHLLNELNIVVTSPQGCVVPGKKNEPMNSVVLANKPRCSPENIKVSVLWSGKNDKRENAFVMEERSFMFSRE